MFSRLSSIFFSLLLAFGATSLNAESRAVKFKSDLIQLKADANKPFSLNMRTLLSDQGTGNLSWSAGAGKPAWLTIDSPKSLMFGTPATSDVGTKSFRLSVQDGESGAIAQIEMKVVIAPVWQEDPVNLGTQNEDVPWTFDLKNKVSDSTGSPLTFQLEIPGTLPSWMTLSSNGILSGTPKRANVGKYSGFAFIVANSSGGSARAMAFGEVLKVIKGPKWLGSPLTIDDAFEDKVYQKNISGLVMNFEGAPLSFKLNNGPLSGWAKVSVDGVVTGTPGKVDLGSNQLTVEVSSTIDGKVFSDIADLKLNVIHTNHTPEWKANPIILPDAPATVAYSQNLSQSATDVDGDKLTFSKVSGPAWVSVSAAGILSGTPSKTDIGESVVTVSVTDGEFSPSVTVKIKVYKLNEPPVWLAKPTVLPDAKEDFVFSQDLKAFVKDPDNDPLTFTLISGPNWAALSPQGILTGTPKANHLGLNRFSIKVADGVSGNDVAEIQVTVQHTNHPPQWTQDPIRFSVPEESVASLDLAPFAVDVDKDKLTFSKSSGPTWGVVSATGALSGTPQIPDEGENNFRVKVDDGQGGSAEVLVIVTVLHINHKPFWTQNPISLPDAPERVMYSQSLATFAQDIDSNDTLSFSKVSGPTWATLSPQGVLQGTPQRPDVGTASFTIRVTDKVGATADVVVKVNVLKVNRPPQWTQNPVLLSDAFEDKAYQFSVASFATDADGDVLTFRKKAGPQWLLVGTNGTLSGTPDQTHVGSYTATFEVTDGEAVVEVSAQGKVIHTNHAPVITNSPNYEVKERQVVSQDLTTVVTDSDNDKLNFALVEASSWVTVDSAGKVTLKPLFGQIGDHTFRYTVSDGALSVEGKFSVKVLRDPRPPVWLENPIRFRAAIDKSFSDVLGAKAKDLDGISLTFSKKSGPAWLSVSASGLLSGTPAKAQLGENTFIITVKNDLLGADANIVIEVFDPNQAPSWKQDPITLPNAQERKSYTAELSSWATDPDASDRLTFSKVTGPNWATISSDGKISGTPSRADVGLNTFRSRVTDLGGKFAEATINITVEYVNQMPVWSAVTLPDAFEEKSYQVSIASLASDPDGDALTFSKVNGPAWLSVSASGSLSGTPSKNDIGTSEMTLAVTDGKLTAETVTRIIVIHVNHPPSIQTELLSFTVKEREIKVEDLAKAVSDVDGDTLKFKLVDSAPWVNLDTSGKLTLKPLFANVGDHSLKFEVSDAEAMSGGTLQIKVIRDPRPPVWLEDPISFTANIEKAFSVSVKDKAKDLDGIALTFSKVAGPAWLSVSTDGALSGTPKKADVGLSTFTLSVKNDVLTANVTVAIEVVNPNKPPVISSSPVFTIKEREVREENLLSVVTDPDGDPLTFTLLTQSEWLTLSTAGKLSLKPKFKQLGEHSFKFSVSDGQTNAEGSFSVKVLRDPRPPMWKEDPLRFTAKIDVDFQTMVSDKAFDLDEIPLSFIKKSGPEWLTVSSTGELKGTPKRENLGENQFVVTSKNDLLGADVQVIITVVDPNQPPFWTQNPITLPNAKEKEFYTQSVSDYAKDPDANEVLSFSKIAGPGWASVSQAGTIAGMPSRSDLGLNTFTVRVTDKGGKFADASIKIVVDIVNAAPEWKQNPIPLGKIPVDEVYQFNLSDLASDADGDKLVFKLSENPAWLSLSGDGQLSGKPSKKDLGAFTATVIVSDGYQEVAAGLFGKVFNTVNTPPTIVPGSLFFVVKERDVLEKRLNSPEMVSDPDDEKLSFEMEPLPSWVKLTVEGKLTATPQHEQVGDHTFQLKVTDERGAVVEAPLYIRVLPNGEGPIWIENPIRLTAVVDRNFVDNIGAKVSDPQGLPLTISKQSGASWLNISPNGALNGVPKVENLGENSFIVIANNGKVSASVTLLVTVSSETPITDSVQIDEAVPGATVENIWVVDNTVCTFSSNDLANLLKNQLPTYFDALSKAQVKHSGILLSSNGKKWDGNPVKNAQGQILFTWKEASVAGDLKRRIESIAIKQCYSSPIWSMFRFFMKLPTMSEIYHDGFMMPEVPMDALVVSKYKDAYATYAASTLQKSWKPADYAKHFLGIHREEKKSFRISAIAPDCLCRSESCGTTRESCERGHENPYEQIANATQGKYYRFSKPFSMASVLSDYAKEVIFRAYVHAKKRIALTKKPLDEKRIEVSIGGKVLPGNTGAQNDPWYFESSSNEVVFQWHLVDLSAYQPGDRIQIKYFSGKKTITLRSESPDRF